MALIKCNECGKDISDTTDVCIHCGAPTSISVKDTNSIEVKSKRHNKRKIVVVIAICFLLFGLIIGIPALVNLRKNGLLSNETFDAEYSEPELEYIYGDAMKTIFEFKDDGTIVYQKCNIETDVCTTPHSYTYQKHGLDIDIYDSSSSLLYDCSFKSNDKILRCSDNSGQYKEYAKTN